MFANKLWNVAISVIVFVSSCTDSRAVSENHLSEIDKDLASILNQAADAPEKDFQLDFAGRFGNKLPQGNDDGSDRIPKELLDDLKSDLNPQDDSEGIPNQLLDTKDENKKEKIAKIMLDILDEDHKDDSDSIPAKELLSGSDSGPQDNDEPIPKELLDYLESEKRKLPRDRVFLKESKDEINKKEKMAKRVLDMLDKDNTHPKEDSYSVPAKELLNGFDSAPEDDGSLTKKMLDDLESGFENNDDTIPKTILDDLQQDASKTNMAIKTGCGLQCKKDALRDILMDELVSRMTTIAKRGDKIPRRMVALWKKYRTKRGNPEKD